MLSEEVENNQVEPLVSVIVPAYMAESKVGPCLRSLAAVDLLASEMEVIFVDDASPDGTAELIQQACNVRDGWKLIRRDRNSGGPSAPRNQGLEEARGKYVCFFDADDEFLPGALEAFVDHARNSGADLIRGPFVVERGSGKRKTVNQLPGYSSSWSLTETAEGLVAKTSTNPPGLVRRSLLLDHGIRWDSSLRMGEDTVFLIEVLRQCREISWCDTPLFIYRNSVGEVRSSTQVYGGRELKNHLEVWRRASALMGEIGSDYWAIRGQIALQTSLIGVIRHGDGTITQRDFDLLADFLNDRRSITEAFSLASRLKEVVSAILARDWAAFQERARHRLLIAGTELKFIEGAYDALEEHFNVRVDEWVGHEKHDESKSRRALAWADTILAEWLLGNAVWYSHQKAPWQRLIVRAHLFERGRSFGREMDASKVDRLICVSAPTAENFLEVFPNIERSSLRVIPNFIDTTAYRRGEGTDRAFKLALVGSVPARKGLLRAIELLHALRVVDQRYTLDIFGKPASAFPWVMRDANEAEYYAECDAALERFGLGEAVTFGGFIDTEEGLADFGYVLSMSDFESFHVAPAEAFAAGNVALFLPWDGVEFIYPKKYVVPSVMDMRDRILSGRDSGHFEEFRAEGDAWVKAEYSLDAFIERFIDLVDRL